MIWSKQELETGFLSDLDRIKSCQFVNLKVLKPGNLYKFFVPDGYDARLVANIVPSAKLFWLSPEDYYLFLGFFNQIKFENYKLSSLYHQVNDYSLSLFLAPNSVKLHVSTINLTNFQITEKNDDLKTEIVCFHPSRLKGYYNGR